MFEMEIGAWIWFTVAFGVFLLLLYHVTMEHIEAKRRARNRKQGDPAVATKTHHAAMARESARRQSNEDSESYNAREQDGDTDPANESGALAVIECPRCGNTTHTNFQGSWVCGRC